MKEQQAEITHKVWAEWMKFFIPNKDKFTQEDYKRWGKQMVTKYEDLSEEEKQSDRVVADFVFNNITTIFYD